jgi:hypothetical protein
MSTQILLKGGLGPAPSGLFAQTGDSVPAFGITEQSLIDGGVGTLTVPANGFQVGDSFVASIGGKLNCANNSNLKIFVKSGSATLASSGSINLPQCTNQNFDLQVRFTVRKLGIAGVASIASFGQFTYSKDASTAFEGSDFSLINGTTFDTTLSNTLSITVQWDTDTPTNNIYSESFVLTKIY